MDKYTRHLQQILLKLKDRGKLGFSMIRRIFRPSGKLFLCSAVIAALTGIGASAASAATVAAGCNEDMWKALNAKAEAQVAYDTAVTRTIIDKPDSVLALSCFEKAAAVSAKKGGEIFGGDFTDELKKVMPVADSADYDCDEIQDLWNEIVNDGVNRNAPYATFDDLVAGDTQYPADTPDPGDFKAGWDAARAAHVFRDLKTAVTALPGPPEPPLDFSADKSSCSVLITAGVITSCP